MSLHRPVIEVLADPAEAAARAARIVLDGVAQGRTRVLGLATGGTMIPFYASLIAMARAAAIPFRGLTSFNLDEYVGISPSHPASFHSYMERHVFGPAGFDRSGIHLPDGEAQDLAAEAARYERAIADAGGIDLQMLGIGANGHIGFNEPGSSFASRTRAVALTAQTRADNAADFPGKAVPEQALTMGIATILAAREIVLLATGPRKAAAIASAFAKPPDPDCPASALQSHPRVRVVCDAAAAAALRVRLRMLTDERYAEA